MVCKDLLQSRIVRQNRPGLHTYLFVANMHDPSLGVRGFLLTALREPCWTAGMDLASHKSADNTHEEVETCAS